MPERKGPISFRMDESDYQKFVNYVQNTDLSKSKIAERAAREYVTENTTTLRDRLITALTLIIVTGYPTYAASVGEINIAIGFISLLVLAAISEPELDQIFTRLRSKLP